MAKVRLGDIATVVTKGTTPTTIGFQFEDSGINFVKIESISEDGTFLKEKFSHISDECNVQMRRSQLQENDILFSIAGAIGRSVIVTKEILPANTNQALAIIRVPKGKIDYNYLLYALSSSAINQQATQHQQGVAQLNISLKNVSDFLLPIYTEAMQKRIVQNLKKIDKLIFLRKQQLEKLDELVKARFVEMFGDPDQNPKGWPLVSITEIIRDKASNGFFAKRDAYKDDGNVQILGVSNVVNRMYSNTKELPRTNATQAEKEKYSVKYGDMLFCRSSLVADGIGKASIVAKGTFPNVLFECHVIRLSLDLQKCVPEFVQVLSTTPFFRRQIIAQSKTATMTTIGQDGILKSSVVLPPIDLQNQFAAFVERVDQQKQTVQQSLEKLELMKKALMQEYFG